jgi:hypothetical protein
VPEFRLHRACDQGDDAPPPCGPWQTTTFLGALRAEGFIAPLTADGPINGELFRGRVEQHLAPALQPGDIVVMDNLSSRKLAGVAQRSKQPAWNFVACRRTRPI